MIAPPRPPRILKEASGRSPVWLGTRRSRVQISPHRREEGRLPMDLVKSKHRVADHGEVFTPAWLVDARKEKGTSYISLVLAQLLTLHGAPLLCKDGSEKSTMSPFLLWDFLRGRGQEALPANPYLAPAVGLMQGWQGNRLEIMPRRGQNTRPGICPPTSASRPARRSSSRWIRSRPTARCASAAACLSSSQAPRTTVDRTARASPPGGRSRRSSPAGPTPQGGRG